MQFVKYGDRVNWVVACVLAVVHWWREGVLGVVIYFDEAAAICSVLARHMKDLTTSTHAA